MLYLVLPGGNLKWTDLLGQSLIDSAREDGIDLGDVDWWKDAEREQTSDDVRVAFRFGLASKSGIVVDAGNIVQVRRPAEMRALFAKSAVSRAALEPQLAQVDRLLGEGASEHRKDLDVRVEESLKNSLREADEDAAEILRADVDQSLVEHWKRLGGFVPDPA